MKRYILFAVLTLFGCTQMSSIDVLPTTREHNENCTDMRRFKVFQVFDDSYALASACTADWDSSYCNGAVVLLVPQRNIEYYDDMFVSAPNNKCAVQNGVYKYETKNKTHKTVPIINFEYEFEASSEEETIERFHNYMEDARYKCKLLVVNNKKYNTKANLNKCDCVTDFAVNEILNFKDREFTYFNKEEVIKEFSKKLEEKCGKIPDFMKKFS